MSTTSLYFHRGRLKHTFLFIFFEMNTQERLVHLLKNSCKVASKTYWSTKYPFPFTSPKNIKNQRFSNVFSGYKKGKLVQNGLKSDYWDMEALSINGNSPTRKLHCVLRISTYSVQMWEYKDEKKLRIWTLFTQCQFFLNKVWRTLFFKKKIFMYQVVFWIKVQ